MTATKRRPPGPRGGIGTGNGRDYERDRIGYLLRCQREYGDVFSFSDVSTVVLDPEIIHRLHARTNIEFVTETSLFTERKHTEWLLSTISATMTSRRQGWRGVNKSATSANADRLVSAFDRVVSAVADTEVDVNDVMMRVSGNAIADVLFGGDGTDPEPLVSAVDGAVRATQVMMNRSYRLPSWLPSPALRRMRHTGRRLRAEVEERVNRRGGRPAPERPRDLLDTLLNSSEMDPEQVAVILNLMLRASYGIPGAAMTWAVRQCALQPELVARLRDEADALPEPTGGDRPYAEAVVKEVLRMYPPSWFGGREVVAPASLGGWDFEPGEQVMFSPYVVHRDPRWWTDPEEFRPQRWLDTEPPHARHAYFPFGAGPRICIGNQLGMLELVLFVSRLAAEYDVTVTNVDAAPMTATTILRPVGLRARFSVR